MHRIQVKSPALQGQQDVSNIPNPYHPGRRARRWASHQNARAPPSPSLLRALVPEHSTGPGKSPYKVPTRYRLHANTVTIRYGTEVHGTHSLSSLLHPRDSNKYPFLPPATLLLSPPAITLPPSSILPSSPSVLLGHHSPWHRQHTLRRSHLPWQPGRSPSGTRATIPRRHTLQSNPSPSPTGTSTSTGLTSP